MSVAHVFVVVDEDAEVHAVDGDGFAFDGDFAGELGGGDAGVSVADGFERAAQGVDDFGLGGEGFFEVVVGHIRGHGGAGDAEEVEVGLRDVDEDFGDGADAGGRAPGVFGGGDSLGEGEKLAGGRGPIRRRSLPRCLRSWSQGRGALRAWAWRSVGVSRTRRNKSFFMGKHLSLRSPKLRWLTIWRPCCRWVWGSA